MKRYIVAFLVGLASWVVVASVLNRGLRVALAGYALAEPTMTFTLSMKVARLIRKFGFSKTSRSGILRCARQACLRIYV